MIRKLKSMTSILEKNINSFKPRKETKRNLPHNQLERELKILHQMNDEVEKEFSDFEKSKKMVLDSPETKYT